jgi:hypothetical protein
MTSKFESSHSNVSDSISDASEKALQLQAAPRRKCLVRSGNEGAALKPGRRSLTSGEVCHAADRLAIGADDHVAQGAGIEVDAAQAGARGGRACDRAQDDKPLCRILSG